MDWKKEIKIPRPSLRSVSLKAPSLKRPKALSRGPQIQMPRLVTDLWADLRDRHLLPIVALLIVAIVAAPLLLSSSGEKKAPAAAAASASSGGGETTDSSFTVVPAARNLSGPGKRLGHRQALNPFRIAPGAAAETSEASETGGTTGGAESSTGGNQAAITESSQGGDSSASTVAESGGGRSTAAGTSPSGSSEGTSSSTSEKVTVQHEVVGYTIDMKTGVVPGELKEEAEVEPMTKLPSAKHPLVMFVGLSQDGKRALFLMTSKVTGYYGALHCAVDKQACQMVELKPGHTASFTYGLGADEARYKIVLSKIEPVVKTHENASQKTVRETVRQHPAERGSAVGQARSFSK